MKTTKLFAVAVVAASLWLGSMQAQAQTRKEYMQITAIESVVPGGLGRSRLITTDANNQMQETELKNFFSLVGINFGNIRNNDQVITERINKLTEDGWELDKITTGSYGNEGSTGIFCTRYIFSRPKK